MIARRRLAVPAVLSLVLWTTPAVGKEIPIGEPKTIREAGIEVAAVYLQPIEMEPAVHEEKPLYLRREQSDVHLEADIRALRGNPNGFREGEWVPGLLIRYRLRNVDTGQEQAGILHPMVANDGPHYGANLKMMGLGTYRLTYVVEPPGRAPGEAPVRQGFGRAAGAAPWWKPFSVEWSFKYFGPGKKGGY